MAKRQVFKVASPLGYWVALSRDRWRQIIRFKHPAMQGRERDVRQCVKDPEVIRASVKDANVHLHYRQLKGGFICVVTALPGDNGDHFVVTAYMTDSIKQGNTVWKK